MMANKALEWAVYEDVYQALYYTEGEYRVVSWALYRAVYRALYRAVDVAVAQPEEPLHLGLALYLGSVA